MMLFARARPLLPQGSVVCRWRVHWASHTPATSCYSRKETAVPSQTTTTGKQLAGAGFWCAACVTTVLCHSGVTAACPARCNASPAPVPSGELVAGDAEVQEHHQLKPCLLEGPHQGPDPALLVVEVIQQTLLARPQERPEGSCCVKHHDTWPAGMLMLQRKVHMLEQVLLLAVRAAAETQITTVSLACTLSRRTSEAEKSANTLTVAGKPP